MIETPTVLILGAGASRHVGYPVGPGLQGDMCRRVKTNVFIEMAAKTLGERPPEFYEDVARKLRGWAFSIDAFLEQNVDLIELGKLLIACCLKDREIEDNLFSPNDPGWYQYLFRQLFTKSPDDMCKNDVTILTFNYDRSLECYLHGAIQCHYKLTAEAVLAPFRALKIIHLHGLLGPYPDVPYSQRVDGSILQEIAGSIRIIHEVKEQTSGFCSDDFRRGNEALARAARIYFLGFGFHEENIRRFRFFTPDALRGKQVLATALGFYGPDLTSLMRRLQGYGFSKEVIPNSGVDCNGFFQHYVSLE